MLIRKKKSSFVWEYENAFYWFSKYERLEKIVTHYEILKKFDNISGNVFEFGVFKGVSLIRTLTFLKYLKSNKKVYAFDAFGKFPTKNLTLESDMFFSKQHDKSSLGLSNDTIKKILDKKQLYNYRLIKGNVFDTLEKFVKNYKSKISILFMDLDVYEPTYYVLEKLFSRISKGGIIIFDNFNIVDGETVAVKKFSKKNKLKIKYFNSNKKYAVIIK